MDEKKRRECQDFIDKIEWEGGYEYALMEMSEEEMPTEVLKKLHETAAEGLSKFADACNSLLEHLEHLDEKFGPLKDKED